jgi:hypothetical protein
MPKAIPKKYASLAAPFPLQADAFSCPDSRDFNSVPVRMMSNKALFEHSVNAQGLIFPVCAVPSPLPSEVTVRTVVVR